MVEQTAYAIDRESDEWTAVAADENLALTDYGIDGIKPEMLRYTLFPQFYLQRDLIYDQEKSALTADNYEFQVIPSKDQKSFALSGMDSDLLIFFSRRKDFGGGYYPSQIEISPFDKSWVINLEIDKIKINPRIPYEVWQRD